MLIPIFGRTTRTIAGTTKFAHMQILRLCRLLTPWSRKSNKCPERDTAYMIVLRYPSLEIDADLNFADLNFADLNLPSSGKSRSGRSARSSSSSSTRSVSLYDWCRFMFDFFEQSAPNTSQWSRPSLVMASKQSWVDSSINASLHPSAIFADPQIKICVLGSSKIGLRIWPTLFDFSLSMVYSLFIPFSRE